MTEQHHVAGGPVVLDIGGDVGALVLYTDPAMAGAEIEISKLGHERDGLHVAVHRRRLDDREVHAAVYPDLVAGQYFLWKPDGEPTPPIEIVGGRVTEVRWSDIAG